MVDKQNAVEYEIMDKQTGICYPVKDVDFDSTSVLVKTEIGDVMFDNKNKDGNLINERYFIREIGTRKHPNGVDTVEDITA
jgi:hypothetical protein